jgi:hypothetical protein
VIISSEDIKKGCEITLDYSGACGSSVASRRKFLLERYGFYCRCRGCIGNIVEPVDVLLNFIGDIKRPVEVTTMEILGEKTTEELDALAGFKSWHQDLEKYEKAADDLFHELQGEVEEAVPPAAPTAVRPVIVVEKGIGQ